MILVCARESEKKNAKAPLIYQHLSTNTRDTRPVLYNYFRTTENVQKKYLSSFVIVQLATLMSFIIRKIVLQSAAYTELKRATFHHQPDMYQLLSCNPLRIHGWYTQVQYIRRLFRIAGHISPITNDIVVVAEKISLLSTKRKFHFVLYHTAPTIVWKSVWSIVYRINMSPIYFFLYYSSGCSFWTAEDEKPDGQYNSAWAKSDELCRFTIFFFN